MPYIAVNTTRKMDKNAADALRTGFGEIIGLLPGKSEQTVMLDLSGEHIMYFRGEAKESCAYVNIKVYGSLPHAAKSAFTEAVFALVEKVLAVASDDTYISFEEHPIWGAGGTLK